MNYYLLFGDFDCLKAAVQNGADAVYLGSNMFNARISAANFNKEDLKEAINYAKLRNVKVHFALNTLIKDDEFEKAIDLVSYVYSLGADAIIVQDLGLAKYIIRNYTDIEVHASTQMTIHNLQGVLKLQELGFDRVILARELSLHEIEYICQNSDIDIECFVHGALCISYSGQCLFSSSIGARSGNRGKCAQPCRLPYELIAKLKYPPSEQVVDKGYLLSPRDLCTLEYLPDLIKSGVSSFKIEGRMKSPEYVATVTRIYRKYIDLALSDLPYSISENDMIELMQVFNRGMFSSGNLLNEPNTDYVYKDKPNNMGIYVGNISNIDIKKGYITIKPTSNLKIGDKISIENSNKKFTISELLVNGQNVRSVASGITVMVGRIKADIALGNRIYKLTSISHIKAAKQDSEKENIKIPLSAHITVKKNSPMLLEVTSLDKEDGIYFSMSATAHSDIVPIDAVNKPITPERIKEQLLKTNNTPFTFDQITVNIDDNVFIPKISSINSLRRDCLNKLMDIAISRFERELPEKEKTTTIENNTKSIVSTKKYSLLLNELNMNYDYSKLSKIDNIYVPLKYFLQPEYSDILKVLADNSNLYVYLPVVVKDNFRNIIFNNFDKALKSFRIKGLVVTNLACVRFFHKYIHKLDIVANYNLNVFNINTINELKDIHIDRATLSPELNEKDLIGLANKSPIQTELICYGKLPLMNMGYCILGGSNKCYPTCTMRCRENCEYYLKDRLGYEFRIITDNVQTLTTLYNSRITSIPHSNIHADNIRISILDESINEINSIIEHVKNDITFSGEEFTKGNFYKTV